MEKVIVFLLLASFSFVVKAQSLQPNNDYKQKRRFDNLQKRYKPATIMMDGVPQVVYNMPAVPLSNEGKKIGMSGEDTIYVMKTDNMLLQKPNNNATHVPNATDGKVLAVPPAKMP